MTNLNAQAAILLKAVQEFKGCKRNKSGSVNENSRHAVKVRLVTSLQAAGEMSSEAWAMAHELARKYAA